MNVFRTLQKRGLQASLCKLKRRVLLDDRQATERLDFLGAYDYMKRYAYATRKAETATAASLPAPHPGKIWTCWLQGMEQAPHIIKRCTGTMRAHHADDLVVLTDENIPRYVDMPEHITRKRAQGIISNTAYSDILRLLLLNRHGGVWLDGTNFLLGPVPDYIRRPICSCSAMTIPSPAWESSRHARTIPSLPAQVPCCWNIGETSTGK